MKRYIQGATAAMLILACVAAPTLIAGLDPISPSSEPGEILYRNFFDREPVLIFEASGYTLTGALHRRLAVYSDGTASVSMVSGIPNFLLKGADFTTVPMSAVKHLRENLIRAGAHLLKDSQYVVKDVPMSTVTFFADSGPKARSNSYSYHLPHAEWADADAVIDGFIDLWFPGY